MSQTRSDMDKTTEQPVLLCREAGPRDRLTNKTMLMTI